MGETQCDVATAPCGGQCERGLRRARMFGNSGITIGRYFGIPVVLHPTWFILLAILTVSWTNQLSLHGEITKGSAFPWALLSALAAFASLLAHEFGHAFAARWFGIPTRRITLFLLGGVAEIRSESKTPWQEFVIAIAGPVVSFALAAVFGLAFFLSLQVEGGRHIELVMGLLLQINLVFGIFNLLPGYPMDGGRVLRSIMWAIHGDMLKATRTAARGGEIIGFSILGIGLALVLLGNFSGLLMGLTGLFLRWLARMSYRQAQMRAAFERVRVADLMRPVDVVVAGDWPLRQVVRAVYGRYGGERYPVVDDRKVLGYIAAGDVAAVPKSQWDEVSARRLAQPWPRRELLAPGWSALKAYELLGLSHRSSVPVFDGTELVGMVVRSDLNRYLDRFLAETRL